MNRPQQINLTLDEDVSQGTYSNIALVNHSSAEMVIDFARLMPGTPRTRIQQRIIMTPQHAKTFLRTLEDNIRKYEARYGEIRMPGSQEEERMFGFRTPGEDESPEPPPRSKEQP